MAANEAAYIDPTTGLPQLYITEDDSGLHVQERRHPISSGMHGGTLHPSPHNDVCDLPFYKERVSINPSTHIHATTLPRPQIRYAHSQLQVEAPFASSSAGSFWDKASDASKAHACGPHAFSQSYVEGTYLGPTHLSLPRTDSLRSARTIPFNSTENVEYTSASSLSNQGGFPLGTLGLYLPETTTVTQGIGIGSTSHCMYHPICTLPTV